MSAQAFKVKLCRLCGFTNQKKIISLKPTALANHYLKNQTLYQPSYPLALVQCAHCGHVQLETQVDQSKLYRNYQYKTGISPSFCDHFKELAQKIASRLPSNSKKKILEIGSNDGTLLKHFQTLQIPNTGIEPALTFQKTYQKNNLDAYFDFLTLDLAKKIKEEKGTFAAVVGNNVMAHLPNWQETMACLDTLLAPNGFFVFEVSYLLKVYQKNLFDTIYHEHIDYHLVKPLNLFFEKNGFVIADIEKITTHGGSLRFWICRKSTNFNWQRLDQTKKWIQKEIEAGLDKKETWSQWQEQISQKSHEVFQFLNQKKAAGEIIAGFGAPAKATTLISQFQIEKLIDYVVDDSPLKQNFWLPNGKIPIFSTSKLYSQVPHCVIILAWNFADSIINKYKEYSEQNEVEFITLLPQITSTKYGFKANKRKAS